MKHAHDVHYDNLHKQTDLFGIIAVASRKKAMTMLLQNSNMAVQHKESNHSSDVEHRCNLLRDNVLLIE